MQVQYISESEEQTEHIAAQLARRLSAGTFIALTGDLGAGKTVFARGLARGLGISAHVPSPTFTLLREYRNGMLPLYHFDVYRISDPGELDETGFYEYADGDGITVCEWADLIPGEVPEGALRVRIRRLDETRRSIEIGEPE